MAGEDVRFLVTLPTKLADTVEGMAERRRRELRKTSGGKGKFYRNDMIVELLEKAVAVEKTERAAARAAAKTAA